MRVYARVYVYVCVSTLELRECKGGNLGQLVYKWSRCVSICINEWMMDNLSHLMCKVMDVTI